MITPEYAMYHVGIDPEYATPEQARHVQRCVEMSEEWLKGAAGEGVDLMSKTADQLRLMCVCELFEVRRLTDERTTKKVYTALNRTAADLLMQLRCEGLAQAFADEPRRGCGRCR